MMKKHFLLSIIILIALATNAPAQDFYDINTINTIDITFSQSNWDEILTDLYTAGEEERLIATVVINGVQFDSVGVRYKGNSSYHQTNNPKKPLNIKLDHIIDGQELDGCGTLKLANGFKDPSFVRETLSYEIARKFIPASKANYANVYINGNLIGLYTSVQDVDRFFLHNNFHCNDNAFFKGELTNDSPQNLVRVWGYLGPDSTTYEDYYQLESDYGWSDLVEFLDVFNNNTAEVEGVLDVDRHLWMLAFDILMVNLDAPINFGHNFYFYKDSTGRFNPIIWDLNENMGGFTALLGGGGGPGPGGQDLSVTEMQELDSFLNISNPNYPIISKIVPDSTYQKMYIAHMKTIMGEIFSNGWYKTRALEIQNIIEADVRADPNKFYTYSDFRNNIDKSVGSGPQSIVGLTELMEARVAFLNTHPNFQVSAPGITNISNSPANANPNSIVWINAEVSNTNAVLLGYRNSIADAFRRIQMFDDGNNNDRSAGDGIYGASIMVGTTDVQYYIYAENDDAGKFSPERAECEFYTLAVAGDLVINEFMASNDATVADQDGEYDDWIELYNSSSSAISLNGYYLSDDAADLTKWGFPDISIGASDYLIIWADDDEDQSGLHAGFQLSAFGEAIFLVDPNQSVVDEVTFGEQTTDLTSGRYPNGTGSFVSMDPTFSAENQNGIAGIYIGRITTDLTAPAVVGQNIEISFASPGQTSTPYYKYLLRSGYQTQNPSSWQIVQDWSTNNTLQWTPTTESHYILIAYATDDTTGGSFHQAGLSVETSGNSANPIQITDLTTDMDYPQSTGAVITINSTATGGSGPLSYRYYYCKGIGGEWIKIGEYSTDSTCTWTPTENGLYIMVVHVTDDPSGNTFSIAGMTCTIGE